MSRFYRLLELSSFVFLLLAGCSKPEVNQTPQLLFKSGFEKEVYIDTAVDPYNLDYRYIRGTDLSTGFSWPITVLGASGSGLHYIDDDNHQAVFAEIRTTIGPHGDTTRCLYQQENYVYNDGVTQCPYEILNIQDGKSDVYIRYWIKIDSQSVYKPDIWRTFFEWKSKYYAQGLGFRMIAFIYTDDDGIPYWAFQGDRNPSHPLWEIYNKDIPVPVNQWFLTEFYWHWNPGRDGRALWKINGQVVADYHGPTTRNWQPVDFILVFQIYGNSNPKWQYIDDVEIWNGLPQEYEDDR